MERPRNEKCEWQIVALVAATRIDAAGAVKTRVSIEGRTSKKRQMSLSGVAVAIATRFDAAGAVKTHVSLENSATKK